MARRTAARRLSLRSRCTRSEPSVALSVLLAPLARYAREWLATDPSTAALAIRPARQPLPPSQRVAAFLDAEALVDASASWAGIRRSPVGLAIYAACAVRWRWRSANSFQMGPPIWGGVPARH